MVPKNPNGRRLVKETEITRFYEGAPAEPEEPVEEVEDSDQDVDEEDGGGQTMGRRRRR